MTNINPYINFGGNCEEAMNFYRSVFGGEFVGPAKRRREAPRWDRGELKLPDDAKRKVMHMALPISEGSVIMASDAIDGLGPKLTPGNNIAIAIGPDTREEADRLFTGLSKGGKVQMPMADAFWGGYFGSFEDKFGVNWLINVEIKKED